MRVVMAGPLAIVLLLGACGAERVKTTKDMGAGAGGWHIEAREPEPRPEAAAPQPAQPAETPEVIAKREADARAEQQRRDQARANEQRTQAASLHANLKTLADRKDEAGRAAQLGIVRVMIDNLRASLALPIGNPPANALHTAARLHLAQPTKLLLDAGVPVDARDGAGRTALFLAIDTPPLDVPAYHATLAALIAGKANLELAGGGAATPLIVSARRGDLVGVQLLVDAPTPAKVDARDAEGRTALHHATAAGRIDLVKFLLAREADPGPLDLAKRSPLHEAAGAGRLEIATVLLQRGAPVDERDADGRAPLHHAVAARRANIAQLLIEHRADARVRDLLQRTPLQIALETDDVGAIMALVSSGSSIDIDQRVRGEMSLAHYAAAEGELELLRQITGRGARLDLAAEGGNTPLHLAVIRGHRAAAELLLEQGAPVDSTDAEGRTALHRACARADAVLASLLLARGAAPSLADHRGRTALHGAAEAGSTELVERLARDVAKDPVDSDGATPLHLAAAGGSAELVDSLCRLGASHAVKDSAGRTPLHVGAAAGNTAAVRVLLAAGASAAVTDGAGRSPLELAVAAGSATCARVLLADRPLAPEDLARTLRAAPGQGSRVARAMLERRAALEAARVAIEAAPDGPFDERLVPPGWPTAIRDGVREHLKALAANLARHRVALARLVADLPPGMALSEAVRRGIGAVPTGLAAGAGLAREAGEALAADPKRADVFLESVHTLLACELAWFDAVRACGDYELSELEALASRLAELASAAAFDFGRTSAPEAVVRRHGDLVAAIGQRRLAISN